MLQLHVVTFVLENAPLWEHQTARGIAALAHVERDITWFLLDLYVIDLEQPVIHDDLPLVRLLLTELGKGFPLYQISNAIKAAIQLDRQQCFDLLLPRCCCCSQFRCFQHEIPFILAAKYGKSLLLEWLFVHRREWCSNKAIVEAAESGHFEIAQFLVDHLLIDDESSSLAAVKAMANGHVQIVELLLDNCRIDCLECLVSAAVENGSLTAFQWLKARMDNGIGSTQSVCYYDHGYKEMAQLLQDDKFLTTLATKTPLEELHLVDQFFPQVEHHIRGRILLLACQLGDLTRAMRAYSMSKRSPRTLDEQTIEKAITTAARENQIRVLKFFVEQGHSLQCLEQAVDRRGFTRDALDRVLGQLESLQETTSENVPTSCTAANEPPRDSFQQNGWRGSVVNEFMQVMSLSSTSHLDPFRIRESPRVELHRLEQLRDNVANTIRDKLLALASKSGDLTRLKWLYERMDPSDHPKAIETALSAACAEGHVHVVRFLVANGHAVDSLDAAVASGSLPLVHFLREECGVTQLKDLDAAIDITVCDGHTAVVELFDAQRTRPYPAQAFFNAAKSGNLAMLQFLLARSDHAEIYVESLEHAFRGGQLEVTRLLYAEMAKCDHFHSLQAAFWRSFADLNDLKTYYGATRLVTPAHADVLGFLLSQEVNLNDDTLDFVLVIRLVIQMKSLRLLRLLHEKHARGFAKVSLTAAVQSGSLAIVRFLCEHTTVQTGASVVEQAADNGQLQIVEYLVQTRREEVTETALVKAAACGHWKTVRFLYDQGTADAWQRVLGNEAASTQRRIMNCLLQTLEPMGIKLMLWAACRHGNLVAVRWLVENCKQSLDDGAFRTALRLAKSNALESQQLVDLLTEWSRSIPAAMNH